MKKKNAKKKPKNMPWKPPAVAIVSGATFDNQAALERILCDSQGRNIRTVEEFPMLAQLQDGCQSRGIGLKVFRKSEKFSAFENLLYFGHPSIVIALGNRAEMGHYIRRSAEKGVIVTTIS